MNLKKLAVLFGAAIASISLSAEVNKFYIEDFSIGAGETKQVAMILENETIFSAFQADIYLPEGLSIYQEDGEYIFELSSRKGRDHITGSALQSDGAVRVIAYSVTNKNFSGNSGALMYFTVVADESFSGTHKIILDTIEFSTASSVGYVLDAVESTVTGPEQKTDYPIAIKDCESGEISMIVAANENFKFKVTPSTSWEVSAVTFNDTDITSSIDAEGYYTTPAVIQASSIVIVYKSKTSSVESLSVNPVKVLGYTGKIVVKGAEGKLIQIYDLNGVQVSTRVAGSGQRHSSCLQTKFT